MNPLTRALKLAEDPQPGAAAQTAGRPADPMARGLGELGPMRATRHDPAPETLPPAAIAIGDPTGPGLPDGARLAPLRATRADPDPETPSPSALTFGDAHGPETPGTAPLAPSQATKDHAVAVTAAPGDDRAAPESPDPAPAVLGDAPSDSAGAAASDAGAIRTVRREGFRSLPASRGVGGGIGIALSMLAAAGAAAGGGAWLWTTELARPALVRSLPPLPEVAMEPTPVYEGNAAGGGSRKPAGGAASTPQGAPAVFTTAPGNGFPSARTAESAGSGSPSGLSAVTVKNKSLPMLAAAPRSEGHPTPPAAVPENGSPPVLPAATPDRPRYPAPSTAAPGSEGPPAGRAAAPPSESSSIGLPDQGAPGEARGFPAEHDAPEAERDDTAVAPGSGARIAITKRTRADHVAESLERAYEAYLAGDGEAAVQAYRAVLRHEPRNRDALLGLAGVAAQAGRWDEAAGHYATLLASHPADTAARAALIAIGEKDPARAESRLKALLRIEPESAHLHFSLGNLYASQSRWPEAQQSWFSAYHLDRDNADHAYNLAVSLDHMSQSRNALKLYREALVLSRSSPAGFEAEAVRKRIRALESRPDAQRELDSPPVGANAAATAHAR